MCIRDSKDIIIELIKARKPHITETYINFGSINISMAKLSASRQQALMRKYSGKVKYLMMFASVCLIVFTLPKQAKFSYDVEKGRIWNQKDLVSPYNFAILKTQQEIENDRKSALASVTPIYQFDAAAEQRELDGFKNDLAIKWHNAGVTGRQQAYISEGAKLLTDIYEKGIVKLNPKYQQNAEDYAITVLDKNCLLYTSPSPRDRQKAR